MLCSVIAVDLVETFTNNCVNHFLFIFILFGFLFCVPRLRIMYVFVGRGTHWFYMCNTFYRRLLFHIRSPSHRVSCPHTHTCMYYTAIPHIFMHIYTPHSHCIYDMLSHTYRCMCDHTYTNDHTHVYTIHFKHNFISATHTRIQACIHAYMVVQKMGKFVLYCTKFSQPPGVYVWP